jgi:hypothetical protein
VSDRTRRIAAIVVVAIVVAGAVVLAGRETEPLAVTARQRLPADGATVVPARAVSTAWYCAEGTSAATGRARETVIIGNLEDRALEVSVTVMTGGDAAPLTERYELEPYEQRRVEVAGIAESPEPGVVVEVFGGRAVVEHEIQGIAEDVAVGPCARTASTHWYFAEGSTERGAEDWLALFNPFGDDAIVDVSFVDDGGAETPEAGQAIVVPRRSRISVPIHEVARRQGQVGVVVQARTGRVVAERTGIFDGTDARSGITLALGVTALATRWRLPILDVGDGTAESLSIANFAEDAADVEVRVLLDGVTNLPPETVDLTGNSIARVDVGARANSGEGYAVEVVSTTGVPIAVGAFGAWATPSSVTGVATTQGTAAAATRWAFAVGRLDADGESVISALNVSDRPLTVQLYAYTPGDPDSPASAPAEALPPGERVSFSLGARGVRPDQVIVISADGPIVAGREILGPGASLAPGVPFEPVTRSG